MGNSYLKFFLIILYSLITCYKSFAQFDSAKIDLIETTSKRVFDKQIIQKYLNSTDSTDVIASLLSISHSEDTSFIDSIIKLDFAKYGKWIAFALGQINNSSKGKKYLWDKLLDEKNIKHSEFIFNALGKTGNEEDLQKLTDFYSSSKTEFSPEGIEAAILQFRLRNITNERCKEILIREINDVKISLERKKKCLFTLARIGSDSAINDKLNEILISENDNELLQLALMNFRIQKYFPASDQLVQRLLLEDESVKIELIKTIAYSENQALTVSTLANILSDSSVNENILLETLKSLRLKKWYEKILQENKIKEKIKNIITSSIKQVIIKEAIETYSSLFNIRDIAESETITKNIYGANLILLFIKDNTTNFDFKSAYEIYKSIDKPKEKVIALELILNNSEGFSEEKSYQDFLINELLSESPAIISTVADKIDSVFISKNKNELEKIILAQIIKFKNNPDFIEALISLFNLSKRVSEDFQVEIFKELSDTELYSIRKFLHTNNKDFNVGSNPLKNFNDLINNAFNYSGAVIITNKGTIEIKFKPEIAPLTVGNFIFLAKKKFYQDIIFHRVVPGFVIQAGDPTGTGWCGPGYEIISEFSPENFNTGAVGIASAGKDTESSQFFIMQGFYPHLNGRYTLFAELTDGLDVVTKISEDDKIISIDLIK